MRKAARQEIASVTAPESSGPPKAETAHTIASAPNTLGTRAEGKSSGISA